MTPIMNPEMIAHGLQLEQQVADVMRLLADTQADLDRLSGVPAAASAAVALGQRRAALAATVAHLRAGQGELELRLEQRDTELANREAALETARSQLRDLTRRLVRVQEEERRALARDLHDTSGQAMTVINLGLAMLKREGACSDKMHTRIEDLRRVSATVAEDLHRLSVNLRPSSLDRYGLVPALEDLASSLRKQTGIEVDLTAEGFDDRLPGELETALYRIVQEACTNIARYANASHVSIALRRGDETVAVSVEDNGQGFEVAEALGSGRLGLLGMRERAEMLGGALSIESRRGQGVTIRAEAPITEPPVPPAAEPGDPDAAGSAGQAHVPVDTGAPSGAAELARAKALSDALVDITAGMTRANTSDELLAFVLAASARAIDCDHGYVVLREGDGWRIAHGYQLPNVMTGRRVSDEDVPAAAQVEATGKMVVTGDLQADGIPNGMARAWGAHSAASLPLFVADQFLGVATYVRGADAAPLRPSEVEFLTRLASLVSLALENSRLHETESHQRRVLGAVFAGVPVGLAVISGDSLRIELSNAAYRGLTPHPDIDPTGRRYGEIWPEVEGFDKGTMWLSAVLETGNPLDVERHKRVFPDGSEHYFAFHVRRLSWHGEPAALVVLVDTTPLHAAQQALEATNDKLESAYVELQAQAEELADANTHLEAERDRLSTLIANIPDEIWFADAEGNVTAANPAAVHGVGFKARGDAFQPFPDWTSLEILNPEGQPRPVEQAPLMAALRGERVERQEEIVRNRRTGQWRYREANGGAIRDSSGAITGAVIVVRDITGEKSADEERRRAAESLARGEAIYRAIAQSFPEGAIYVFDHGLRYLVVEGELLRTLGQTREAMEGKAIQEAFDPETVAIIEPRYRRTLAGEAMHFETQHGPQYGNRVIAADYRPIRNAEGGVMAGLLVASDLSERVRMEELLQRQAEELREANERLEQRVQERTVEMAVMLDQIEVHRAQLQALSQRLVDMQEHERSYVADQLYNQAAQILSAVRMQLWALERHWGEQTPAEHLAGMKNALDQTILALHDLATELRPVGLARATLCDVLRGDVARFAAAHDMTFRFYAGGTEDLRVPPAVVTAVYRAIQEALANIAEHAHAGEITLSLTRARESLIVSLMDDGDGFDPAAPPRPGALGLVSMRERIRSVGGSLEISSAAGGTRVLLEVPVGEKDER